MSVYGVLRLTSFDDSKLRLRTAYSAGIRPVPVFFDKPSFFFDKLESGIGRIFPGLSLIVGAGPYGCMYVCIRNQNNNIFKTQKIFIMIRLSHIAPSMKYKTNVIRIAVTLALLFICSLQPAKAASAITAARIAGSNEQTLVYQRSVNPYIGITVANAAGRGYTIADKNGKIILKGKISSDKTFFVATAKLAYGSYQFLVGGTLMQQFIIQ